MEQQQVTISAGSVDITPRQPLALGGYEKRREAFKAVSDRLEANVLIIQSGSSRVTIVTTDLLYPGETLRTSLVDSLGVRDRESKLFLSASHTHNAPMTAPSMLRLGVPNADYIGYVAAQITALVKSIEQQETPVVCTYHEGILDHSMNRRSVCRRLTRAGFSRSVGFGPNPAGKRDESVRVLKFARPGGEPIAVIWNYACHACDFFDRLQVSAAYPGRARSRLRSKFGDIPVLFFQGFSGDVRPAFVGMPRGIKELARRVLSGPQFRLPLKQEWERWSDSLADSVASLTCSSPTTVEIHAPVDRRMEIPESEFAVGGSGDKSLYWHLIDCGGFRIVGINAEPVTEYRPLIEKYLNTTPFLTVGCLDQTHCYLPTEEMIVEGGYEVEGFRSLFGFDGHFREQLQRPIIEGLRTAIS